MGKVIEVPTAACDVCSKQVIEPTMASFGSEESGYEDICPRCFNERCAFSEDLSAACPTVPN